MRTNSNIAGLVDTRHSSPDRLFRADTVCKVTRMLNDFEEQVCHLFLPMHNCTSMSGAIGLAKRAHPEVRSVAIYEGDALINVYARDGDDWSAVRYGRNREGEPHHDTANRTSTSDLAARDDAPAAIETARGGVADELRS